MPDFSIENTIFARGDALLIGCLFAIEYERITGWVEAKKKYFVYALPALLLLILLNYLFSAVARKLHSQIILFIASISYGLIGSVGLLTNLLLGLIIVYSINVKNAWFKLINSAIMNHIGKLSYSIYLWQTFFIVYIQDTYKINLIVTVALIYLAACFSYYFIEKSFLRFKDKFTHLEPLEKMK
ncbi:hypothetical protein GCM10027190_32630 [Spirosoma areae]